MCLESMLKRMECESEGTEDGKVEKHNPLCVRHTNTSTGIRPIVNTEILIIGSLRMTQLPSASSSSPSCTSSFLKAIKL